MEGYLELIVGCMFSGKTTFLLNKYNELIKKYKIIVINSILDKYSSDEYLVSHDKKKIPAIKLVNLLDSNNEIEDAMNYDIILINEGQFFSDLIHFTKIALLQKKHIYISGLDGDFNRNKFGDILDLIPLADSIIKLKGECFNCKKKNSAIFTYRKGNNTNKILIDNDMYIPVCRNCYDQLTE